MTMHKRFHNPYHFVPVVGAQSQGKDAETPAESAELSVEAFVAGETRHVTHDRYVASTTHGSNAAACYSGRLLCRLTTIDPIVIGHTRKERNDKSHKVAPFELPHEEGKPAIPASTLRGLISTLAEAASNSALRVLDNRVLSFRAPMEKSLSAIGMIVEVEPTEGKKAFELQPLALPTMRQSDGDSATFDENDGKRYEKMFPLACVPPLKVYVGNAQEIRSEAFVAGFPLQTFVWENPQFVYARLHPRTWKADYRIPRDPFLYFKGGRLLSQMTSGDKALVNEKNLPTDEAARRQYTRGILRVLGVLGRDDIPKTKKHELFLPYPEDIEKTPTFPIESEALRQFYTLADERAAARKKEPALPYEPRGTRGKRQPGDLYRLRHGDLVYFRPNADGTAVAEIALSAIWRSSADTTHHFFQSIDPELLPFHRQRRKRLSVAEQLFGFVENRQGEQSSGDNDQPALALAGRLRFSFGRLHTSREKPYYEGEVLLKILDAPKPPMPTFYFKNRDGSDRYISKERLTPTRHEPQGRKMYLHRYEKDQEPWHTHIPNDDLTQKSWVTPVQAGLTFYCHIDFDNLSEHELGLLCYAVRPNDAFRHKIGMGKPIGLGKVQLDPVALFSIDREKRYRETSLFEGSRYHAVWIAKQESVQEWPECYDRERREHLAGLENGPQFQALRDGFVQTMNDDIKYAIELLGDPDAVRAPVHTPQVLLEQGNNHERLQMMEKETYKWFVDNEKRAKTALDGKFQRLRPLVKGEKLPLLERHPPSQSE